MKTLLIIDDAPMVRETMGSAIEKAGVRVLRANSGLAGVKIYKESKPDVIFLDIKLPDIHGLNVLQQIKQVDPKACVYIMTGSDSELYKKKAEELGAAGYMVKPVYLQALLDILEVKL